MNYKIVRTDKADEQLRNDILYIAKDTGSVERALSYLEKIENAVNLIGTTPYIGTKPRYSILRKQGYLVLIVEKHLIFYKVSEENKTVIIYAVIDGRREYRDLI